MSINPDNITTIRVDQLVESTLNLTNEFPHSEDTTLRKATIQSLVDLVSAAVGSGSGVGFLPISVTDGQQLPNTPVDPSFFLCGVGTFLNVNGYPDIVCTEEMNAIMSVGDHWQIAVEIPINVDLQTIGISQSVNSGTIDKSPSEDAVYNFIAQWLPKASLGYFDYADLATQTTPITVAPNTQTLLTNDADGPDTNISQPPYGVSVIWYGGETANAFDFQQLSVGDTVDIRVHIKTTTTTANQKYHIDMKFAIGSASEFENRIFSQYVKTATEDEQSFVTTLYIGSEDVKNYPARLYITSDDDATVKVVGWFCRVFRKNVNIVGFDDPANLISTDADNSIVLGTDNKLWSGGGGGSTPDATTTTKGKLKLAGDLAGTADLPTVPALADKENISNKGIANGYVPLNSSTEIDLAYFPDAILGQLLYGGVVNISTAVATLTNNAKTKLGTALSTITLTNDATAITGYTANEGIYYIATVAGTFASISFEVGDWLVSIGSAWVKIDNTDAISSFNGRTGAITLISSDISSALGATPVTGAGLSNQIAYFTANGSAIAGLDTTTYPSLTELAYVKGVTSSIQTQLDAKISAISPTLTGLTTLTGTSQTGSSANGILSLTQTWNTTGSPTAIILNVTNTASGSASRLLDLQTGGVSRFAVDKLGGMSATLITSSAEINAGLANAFTWGTTNSRSTIYSPSNGVIRLSNGTGTDFSRLQFGLTNSTAPAIKRNGTALNFRLADDSADCPITASNGTFSGNLIASGTTSVLRLKGYTVATLPSGTQGDNAFVTDALAPTILNTVVGGGTVVVRVFYNGTNWIVQ